MFAEMSRPWLQECRTSVLCMQVRRRLPKRIYVPLPDAAGRRAIIQHLLRGQEHRLSGMDMQRIVASTEG